MIMISYYSELRYKEVIDIHTGLRLGFICDLELEDRDGRICSVICPGKPRLLGLLGREDDYIIPWQSIVKIGGDIILVETRGNVSRRKRRARLL